ncbi:MAG: hypothetical protein KBD01_20015 [Acidobacteria bacterium]|nr:hypothetical protein [Acidobacteriota bacterium]
MGEQILLLLAFGASSAPTCADGAGPAASVAVMLTIPAPGHASARELKGALREVKRLLAPAGIALLRGDGCSVSVASRSIDVRLVESDDACLPDILGSTYIALATEDPPRIVVYVDRVREVSGNRWYPLLLGRVLAHELVHALVGTGGHEPAGLMRAGWKLADACEPMPARSALSAAMRARLRAALAAPGPRDETRSAFTVDRATIDPVVPCAQPAP